MHAQVLKKLNNLSGEIKLLSTKGLIVQNIFLMVDLKVILYFSQVLSILNSSQIK